MNENLLRDLIRRVVIVTVFVVAIGTGLYIELKPEKPDNLPYNIEIKPLVLGESEVNLIPNVTEKVVVSDVKSLDDFTKIVKTFPDGAFKSNLLFVLAADYNGDSVKLNEILQAYGMLLKAQMKKNNSL